MSHYRFSILNALRFAFYTLIEHFAFFLALSCTYLATMTLATLAIYGLGILPFTNQITEIGNILSDTGLAKTDIAHHIIKQLGLKFGLVMGAASFIVFLISRYLSLGFTKASLEFYDKDRSNVGAIFSPYHLIFKDAVATILYFAICALGLCLFVFPGIYCAIVFGFYHQVIVDQQVGPIEALQKSRSLTKGTRGNLLALGALFGLLNYAACMLFGFIFLISWPLTSLAYIYVYRTLLGRHPAPHIITQ